MYSKPFKFKLEKILQMKIEEEEEQKKVFAKAMKKLQVEEEKLQKLQNLLEYKKEEFKIKLLQANEAHFFKSFSDYLEKLKKDIELQKVVVEKCRLEVEIEKRKYNKWKYEYNKMEIWQKVLIMRKKINLILIDY